MNLAHLGQRSLLLGTGAAVTLSALGVPAAWPFAGKMYVHQYTPQAFFDAADAWLDVHDRASDTRRNLRDLTGGVAASGWRSEDGRAFERRVDAYLADLRGIELRAVVTALVLHTAGAALAAFVLFQFLVAAALAAVAAWVLAAAVTPVSLTAARTAATQCLTRLFSVYRTTEKLLDQLLHGCAAALTAAVAVRVGREALRGDDTALTDLASATMAQGPLLVWGTANRVERDLTAHALALPLAGTGLPQVAGAKAAYDVGAGSQAITGRHLPEQGADGSYAFPWE
ncbi:hypothetical protein GCM10009850_021950 [Nonomuraea monospora]|uniref:Uncharacterized protein n=1 Tax=Nonomuraea monospora TaxID=568818 RepID=A0ABN3CBJ9_9ACTN